MTISRTGCTNT